MPFTQKLSFRRVLQIGNRVQVPKLIRSQFKIESDQVLKVMIDVLDLDKGCQSFYAKMEKDGRILIPTVVLLLLQDENGSLAGHILDVTIEPAQ
jgi:hypothetical protein